jgi:TRAP-type C4-dicarboxylate transport system permease small subunit
VRFILDILSAIDRGLGFGLRWLCIGCISILLVVLSAVVAIRFFPIAHLSWSDEVVEWCFAWLVFMGAAALYRESEHFCVDLLTCRLERRPSGFALSLFTEGLCAVFLILFTYYGYRLTAAANDRSPILEWSRRLWYACIPLAGAIMTAYSIRNIARVVVKFLAQKRSSEPASPDET